MEAITLLKHMPTRLVSRVYIHAVYRRYGETEKRRNRHFCEGSSDCRGQSLDLSTKAGMKALAAAGLPASTTSTIKHNKRMDCRRHRREHLHEIYYWIHLADDWERMVAIHCRRRNIDGGRQWEVWHGKPV